MKKITLLSFAAALFFLTSCETTREISIADNGSGTILTTMDMSSMMGIAKMSGKTEELGKQTALDTTISFATLLDSIPDLGPQDKELLKKGTMGMVMNMENEQFLAKISFPFSNVSEITKLQSLTGKMMQEAMKKQMEGKGPGEMGGEGDLPSGAFDDYFKSTFTAGLIEMKLNKEKYATIGEDKNMQGMKEAMGQGLPMVNKWIIHLPKPAKKVEGAYAKLSEDKKTVTIENDMNEFFDDATKLEFRVEY
ncbi:MAG: hypothetical protein ABW007_17600 [Chitinophagaceae bacterium]